MLGHLQQGRIWEMLVWRMLSWGKASPSEDNCIEMRVLVWNVRGVGKPSFYSTFRRLRQLYNPELYILLETRLYRPDLDRFRWHFPGDLHCYAIESQGLSGGIIMSWHRG